MEFQNEAQILKLLCFTSNSGLPGGKSRWRRPAPGVDCWPGIVSFRATSGAKEWHNVELEAGPRDLVLEARQVSTAGRSACEWLVPKALFAIRLMKPNAFPSRPRIDNLTPFKYLPRMDLADIFPSSMALSDPVYSTLLAVA